MTLTLVRAIIGSRVIGAGREAFGGEYRERALVGKGH